MHFEAHTAPHSDQRYETVGDWKLVDESILVKVSEMGNSDWEFLVAIHELVEAYSCAKFGVTEEDVTDFDIAYERDRAEGDVSEPGDSPAAPYQKHHQFASIIERLLAVHLGVNWQEYEAKINSLSSEAGEAKEEDANDQA
jgi:hypothetical protein